MEEKKRLNVDNETSYAIRNRRTFILILSWLMLIGGIITILAGSENYESSLTIIGIAIAISAIPGFCISGLFRGLCTIVENAETEENYIIVRKKVKIEPGLKHNPRPDFNEKLGRL